MTSKTSAKHNASPANISFTRTPTRAYPRPRSKKTGWKMDGSKEMKIIEDVDNESIPLTDIEVKKETNRIELNRRTSIKESEQQNGNGVDTTSHPEIPNAIQFDDEEENTEEFAVTTNEFEAVQQNEVDTQGNMITHNRVRFDASNGVGVTNIADVTAVKTDIKCNGSIVNNTTGVSHSLMPRTEDEANARKESLSVPGLTPSSSDRRHSIASSRKDSIMSFGRESSKMSMGSRRSIDLQFNYTAVQMPQEDAVKSSVFAQDDSWIRIAIPYLPLGLAVVCLTLNIFVPGSGTVLSGFSIFCCAKSRVPPKYDQDLLLILCVNIWVGVAQLFTVTFLLVGWFWSLAWGIKMVILSVERRRELKEKRTKELQALALSAFGSTIAGGRLASIT